MSCSRGQSSRPPLGEQCAWTNGSGIPVTASIGLLESLTLAERRSVASGRQFLEHPWKSLRVLLHRVTGPVEADCTLFTGQRVRVVLPEVVGADLYRHTYIEPGLTRVLLEHLRPGMVVVDVGAHYGYYSLIASRAVGQGGLVLSVEPARSTFQLLVHNVGVLDNVRPFQLALRSVGGTVTLRDFGRRHSSLNTVMAGARVPATERRRLRGTTYSVPCATLDELVRREGVAPDFVKLDVEGAELSVLQGMNRTLRDGSPMVTVETGDYGGMRSPATAECIDYLTALGYSCLEYANGLRPHDRRPRYGYDNLYFVRAA
jgi:FkbM family methyltransferase